MAGKRDYISVICFRVLFLYVAICFPLEAKSQELHCNVEVNSSSIEGTYKSVFDALQRDMAAYLNENKWTDMVFSPIERIECRLFLTVREYTDDKVKGDIQVQLLRPVFNSSYTTTLLNFKDNNIEFDYQEGDPIVFNANDWGGNLIAILDFYAYMFLALDSDSFSPRGGEIFYEKAAAVVQRAQSNGGSGWRVFEDNRNRGAVLNAFTNVNTSGIRELYYKYHRRGLDEMALSPDKGRMAITESLEEIQKIGESSPMSVGLTIFRDSKLDELVNIYSKSSNQEREKAYGILSSVFPADEERLKKIKDPEDK